jgi:TetR/AcrR family transcriptional repressor of nem operon
MPRESHKQKLLDEGLRVVHERGYGGAGVRGIVAAAGVPQGSFTNHFASKEAFGLEVLDLYYARVQDVVLKTLRNDELPPLKRLRDYIDVVLNQTAKGGARRGCVFGNFSAEATEENEVIRKRLVEIFDELQGSIEYCLRAAVKAGELPAATKIRELAGFILSSLQGAILLSKAYRSVAPIERFKRVLLSSIAAS